MIVPRVSIPECFQRPGLVNFRVWTYQYHEVLPKEHKRYFFDRTPISDREIEAARKKLAELGTALSNHQVPGNG